MSDLKKDFMNRIRPLAESLLVYAQEAGRPFGISDAKISIAVAESRKAEVEKTEASNIVTGNTCQVSVSLYADDRILSFGTNTLNEQVLRRTIMDNMEVIQLAPENATKRLLESDKVYKGEPENLDLYDHNQPDLETLIAYAREMEAAALSQPKIKTTRSVSISKSNSHGLTLATNGRDHCESRTMYSASASVVAEDESGMQIANDYNMSRHFSDMSAPGELGKNAGVKAAAKLQAIFPETGKFPIVLSLDAAEEFFSSIYKAIGGTAVHRGATFMKDRIGQQVMSKGITLIDTPAILRGLGSGAVDGAGMEAKEITFIEDGVLKSYLVSLQEARKLGIEPIGRDGGLTNSRILPGNLAPEELMEDIKEGIYIKHFQGGIVDVNTGTHSRQAYGTLIKNGKITDIAAEGFVVSGNLKDMFMNIVLANDTPPLPNPRYTLAAPTTRIDGITIAGR